MENHINHETCVSCGLCALICPAEIIEKSTTGKIDFIESKNHICAKCGHCMAMCSSKSVMIKDLSYDDIFDLKPHGIDYDNFTQFLHARRSIRFFKDKPVPDEVIAKIIEGLSSAPYGMAIDKVDITVVNNKELIEKTIPLFTKKYSEISKYVHNPLVKWIVKRKVPAETYSVLKNFLFPQLEMGYHTHADHDDITYHAPSLLLFHGKKDAEEHTVDSYIYLTYAFLIAHSLGLGATVIGLIAPVVNQSKELQKIFQIPEGNEVVTSLILGYPKVHFKRGVRRERKNVNWIN